MLPGSIEVTLDPLTFTHAVIIGAGRQMRAIAKGRKHNNLRNDSSYDWGTNIEAACAECAFAQWRGLFWMGGGAERDLSDVGEYSVRHSRYQGGRLLITKEDRARFSADTKVVLVTGIPPVLTMQGWIEIGETEDDAYWTDPQQGRFCWAVPQSDLKPMSQLEQK
jgi:hypothetical protein